MQITQNTSARVLVRLLDISGVPVAGVAYGSVTAVVGKSNTTEATLVLTGSDWNEADNGLAGKGVYWLTLPTTATDQLGELIYCVSVSGAVDFVRNVEIVSTADIASVLTILGTPAGSSIADDISNISIDPSSVATAVWDALISTLTTTGSIGEALNNGLKSLLNRAKINSSTNQLEVYESDGTTLAFSFDLKDITGSPTATGATERVPA